MTLMAFQFALPRLSSWFQQISLTRRVGGIASVLCVWHFQSVLSLVRSEETKKRMKASGMYLDVRMGHERMAVGDYGV